MDKYRHYNIIALCPLLTILLLAILTSGCNTNPQASTDEDSTDGFEITDIIFSDDYTKMTADVQITLNSGTIYLTDSSIKNTRIYETIFDYDTVSDRFAPKLESIQNITSYVYDSIGLKIVVLADLTLPQSSVNQEREAVIQLKRVFSQENLYIAFLKSDGEVTPTQLLTDYIVENDFISTLNPDKHLYAGILSKLRELDSEESPLSSAHYSALIVLSDGMVWGYDEPYDPNHFEVQQQLIDYIDSVAVGRPFYYSNVPCREEDSPTFVDGANNVIQLLCRNTNGIYQDSFNIVKYCAAIDSAFGLGPKDLRFNIKIPNGKIFNGREHNLHIEYWDGDSLITSGSKAFRLGNEFQPIIVNGLSGKFITISGFLIGLILIIAVYIILQFIEPFIRNLVFRHKYVARYTGPDLTVSGSTVSSSCYLCKAPFQKGDTIVAKCQHTMHKECWDANEYHCPEHGNRCKEGTHYYNGNNIFDPRNAQYYLIWVIMAIIAATLSWIFNTNVGVQISESLASRMLCRFYGLEQGSPEAINRLTNYMSYLYRLPSVAMSLGFFLTMSLSPLILRHRSFLKRALEVMVRSIIAMLIGFIIFNTFTFVCITFNITYSQNLIALGGWILFSILLILTLTYRTKVKLRKKWIIASIAVSVITVWLWAYFFVDVILDYRIDLLFSHIIYTVGIALSFCSAVPRSDHYVLHIEGPVKATDIALYKWFQSDPTTVVTLGKSVDCSIQMIWDIKSDIAPVQAQIIMQKTVPYLCPLEEGVRTADGTPIPPEKRIKLYHNTGFRIGETTFTYRESDIC